MAAFSQIPQENIPQNRSIFSNVSVSPKAWTNRYKLVESSLVVADFNKNVQETPKTTRFSPKSCNKIEKSTLKQSFPNLLCLKKSTSTSSENTLKTLNVNALGAENLSWNEYYNGKENTTRTFDSFRSDRDGGYEDASSSSKRVDCLSNPNKNRKSFHQNVEDALNSLLWQPYEYQTKTSATSMTSRFVLEFVYVCFLYRMLMVIVLTSGFSF